MMTSHDGLPPGAVPIRLYNAIGANLATTATMPAVPGWINVIEGYDFTTTGATAAAVVDISISGMLGRKVAIPGSVTAVASDSFRPPRGIAAAAANAALTVSVGAPGLGNTGGNLSVYGYRIKG